MLNRKYYYTIKSTEYGWNIKYLRNDQKINTNPSIEIKSYYEAILENWIDEEPLNNRYHRYQNWIFFWWKDFYNSSWFESSSYLSTQYCPRFNIIQNKLKTNQTSYIWATTLSALVAIWSVESPPLWDTWVAYCLLYSVGR